MDKYQPGDVVGGYAIETITHLKARIARLTELLRQLDEHDKAMAEFRPPPEPTKH